MSKRIERRIAASLERSQTVIRLALRRIARGAAVGRTDVAAIEVLMDASVIRGRILQIADDYAADPYPTNSPRTDKRKARQ